MRGLLAVDGSRALMLADELSHREDAAAAGLRGPGPPADLGRRASAIGHGRCDVAAPDDGAMTNDHEVRLT
jgi:hypothetical protein